MEKERILLYVSPEFIKFMSQNTPPGRLFAEYWGNYFEDETFTWRNKMLDTLNKEINPHD